MPGAERTAITRQVIALKHQIREKTAQLETLERRLTRSRPANYLDQQQEDQ